MISSWTRRRGLVAALTGLLVAALLATGAKADYQIAPGDTLELSVPGLPELAQKGQVNVDGDVSFPLVGLLRVKGLTMGEAQGKMRSLLPTKEFRRRTADGREYPVIINPDEVSLVVFEYRPVYLNGDVAKPGEQPYRPGLTVRQAIALAGGYDIMRFRMNNPFLEQSDLRSQYHASWNEFALEQTRIARLKAELEGRPTLEKSDLSDMPIPKALAAGITENATRQLELRTEDLAKERAYLGRALGQEDTRISVLGEQQSKEEEGMRVDSEDLDRVQDAYKKGTVPITRLVDAKRLSLLSSTRTLQTSVQLAQVQRERGELGRKLERLDDSRRAEVLANLQDATVKLATIRAQIESTSEKLVYTGMVRSQLTRGQGSKAQLFIIRSGDKGHERVEAQEDTPLRPGDVVEVALQADLVPGLPAK